jgi:hypothetical protein
MLHTMMCAPSSNLLSIDSDSDLSVHIPYVLHSDTTRALWVHLQWPVTTLVYSTLLVLYDAKVAWFNRYSRLHTNGWNCSSPTTKSAKSWTHHVWPYHSTAIEPINEPIYQHVIPLCYYTSIKHQLITHPPSQGSSHLVESGSTFQVYAQVQAVRIEWQATTVAVHTSTSPQPTTIIAVQSHTNSTQESGRSVTMSEKFAPNQVWDCVTPWINARKMWENHGSMY